jgi:hypothetical protein
VLCWWHVRKQAKRATRDATVGAGLQVLTEIQNIHQNEVKIKSTKSKYTKSRKSKKSTNARASASQKPTFWDGTFKLPAFQSDTDVLQIPACSYHPKTMHSESGSFN